MSRRQRSSLAFSLIEVAVVLSIIALLTTIAVPSLGNNVRRAYLAGTADDVAAFLTRAQAEAMANRRCVKVYVDTATGNLNADRLNSFDCDTVLSTVAAVQIDTSAGAGKWINFAKLKMPSKAVSVSITTVPSHTTATYLGGTEQDQLRFRQSGRLWNDDLTFTDDDGVITASIAENGIQVRKRIVVEAQGLICVLPLNQTPNGTGNNLSCL